jgi:hypothetical protein
MCKVQLRMSSSTGLCPLLLPNYDCLGVSYQLQLSAEQMQLFNVADIICHVSVPHGSYQALQAAEKRLGVGFVANTTSFQRC